MAALDTAFLAEVNPWTPYITGRPALATLLIGNNDFSEALTAKECFDRKQLYLATKLRPSGCIIVDMTVPASSSQPPGSDWDNKRLAYNVLTLANTSGRADLVIDLAAITAGMTFPDGTHFSPTQAVTIGTAIYNATTSHFGW